MNFGDILDAWEKEQKSAEKKGEKSTGQEWRNKKTAPDSARKDAARPQSGRRRQKASRRVSTPPMPPQGQAQSIYARYARSLLSINPSASIFAAYAWYSASPSGCPAGERAGPQSSPM